MKVYHVIVEQTEDGWLAAHTLEDDSVHTQGRTLDEVTANIREVAHLLNDEADVQVELIVPSQVRTQTANRRRAGKRPSRSLRQSPSKV
ncbi:MAG: type II toxin-antitoxin system HicB family antitoxin [Phycisphaerales bacterium]